MDRKHNNALVPYAKALRKDMTKEERHLWYDYLKSHSVRFVRQKVLGKYIVDFYSAKAKLVIELDGSQHYEEKAQAYDAARDMYLQAYGLRQHRTENGDAKNHRV